VSEAPPAVPRTRSAVLRTARGAVAAILLAFFARPAAADMVRTPAPIRGDFAREPAARTLERLRFDPEARAGSLSPTAYVSLGILALTLLVGIIAIIGYSIWHEDRKDDPLNP
jgi:hypothetical protein